LQRGQRESRAIGKNIELIRSRVGRMFQAIFQINNLNRSLRFSFHELFQKVEEVPGKEVMDERLFWIVR
jgi:hypothetical protein